MSLDDIQTIINIILVVGLCDLILFIFVGLSIISMNIHIKQLVDLEYKKYKENNGKDSISS